MSRRRLAGAATVAAACALTSATFLSGCAREQPTRLGGGTPLARAIDRAADFLGSHPLGHAELWFTQQAAFRLGRGFPGWAATLRASGPPQWAERVLEGARDLPMHRFPPLEAPRVVAVDSSPALSSSPEEATQEIGVLFFAVEDCTHADATSREKLQRMLENEAHGYVLAHQAWALAVSVTRGCLTPDQGEALRRSMGLRILSELVASQGLTDVDLERMAVLCVLDLCHWVPKDFFDRAIARQLPSGSWGSIPAPGVDPSRVSEEHSAALGFYALASLQALADLGTKGMGRLSCAGRSASP